jgi:hypothetical protein
MVDDDAMYETIYGSIKFTINNFAISKYVAILYLVQVLTI